MSAASAAPPEDELDLAALLEENAALRAEHEQLLAETAQYGLMLELPNEPTSPASAKAVSSRYEAMERQRKALLGVRRLGDELEELSMRNAKLKGEAGQLREENTRLVEQNAALRAASRASTPALATPTGPARTAARTPAVRTPVAQNVIGTGVDDPIKPELMVAGSLVLPPGLEKRAAEISAAIKLGDQEKLNTCSVEQRKELVAAMLKVGLFDAAVPASLAPAPPPAQVPFNLPPAAAIAAKCTHDPAGAVQGSAEKAAPPPVTARSGAPAPISAAAAFGGRKATAASAAVPGATTTIAAKLAPVVAVSQGRGGSLEKQAQDITELLSSCSDSERKELVADMLRQGLFGGSGYSPPSTAALPRYEHKVTTAEPATVEEGLFGNHQVRNRRDSPSRTSFPSPSRSSVGEFRNLRKFSADYGENSMLKLEEMDENSRERVVREKLQELNTRFRA